MPAADREGSFLHRNFEFFNKSFLLCSPSTTQDKFPFFEIHILENVGPAKYFLVQNSLIIMENINSSGNCLQSLLLCSPSITQHKFPFFEIHILENVGQGNNSNFKTV